MFFLSGLFECPNIDGVASVAGNKVWALLLSMILRFIVILRIFFWKLLPEYERLPVGSLQFSQIWSLKFLAFSPSSSHEGPEMYKSSSWIIFWKIRKFKFRSKLVRWTSSELLQLNLSLFKVELFQTWSIVHQIIQSYLHY